MPRGMLAQILWEDPRRRPERLRAVTAEAAATPMSHLAALLERTMVPRHPLGDQASVREETEFLLRCAAEVEHQFIVQYLYAAYSIDSGMAGAPPEAGDWAFELVQIATEEMGHLLTVQNLLLCIGAQPYLERQTAPVPDLHPFPLTLEPFSRRFVSRFLVAESPADPEALPPELRHLKETIDHVGAIYAMLYWLFQESDERVCPWMLPEDVPFPSGRHLAEADFADPTVFADRINQQGDWQATGTSIHVLPNAGQTTRRQMAEAARGAIFDVAAQGEGPTDPQDDPGPCPPLPAMDSHYEVLLEIYLRLKALEEAGGSAPVRQVPTDPQVSQITHPVANLLARAMDLRYNLLMLEIAIAVFTPRSLVVNGENVLEEVASWALGDMRRAIRPMGEVIVTLPRDLDGSATDAAAGPPYTLPAEPFPEDERGRWLRLIEFLDAYAALLAEPGTGSDPDVEEILTRAASRDEVRRQLAEAVLAQLSV